MSDTQLGCRSELFCLSFGGLPGQAGYSDHQGAWKSTPI